MQHTIDRREVEAKRALPKEESPVSKDQQAAASGQVGAAARLGQERVNRLGCGHVLPTCCLPAWLWTCAAHLLSCCLCSMLYLPPHFLASLRRLFTRPPVQLHPSAAHQEDFCGRPGSVCG